METLRSIGRTAHDFGRSVVEWRSPASGLYLMAVNSVFWLLAVYGEPVIQSRVLASLSAGIVGWDVLLSPSRDRSTLVHLLLWPISSLWRTAGVGLGLYGIHQIREEDFERACIVTYSALGCLLVNPVWQYHKVNDKIVRVSTAAYRKIKAGVDYAIITPIVKVYRAVKYVVLLEFVPPLISWIGGKLSRMRDRIYDRCRAIRDWWKGWVMLPIKEKMYSIGRFFRYWFCAEWWPSLKQKIINRYHKIREVWLRFFDWACFWTVYIVCGHWVKPCARYLRDRLIELGSFLHRTVWTPVKIWLIEQACFAFGLAKIAVKTIALAIRDSILWPIGILLADLLFQAAKLFYDTAIHPLLLILYDKYKIFEDYALIYVIGPTCEKIINNIPEKNPLCDESDVELEGFLPEGIDDEAERESDREHDSAVEDDFLPSDAPLDYEESEFTSGLSFPTVDASESSDEEFDLQSRKEQPKVYQRRRGDARTKKGEGPEKEEKREEEGDGDRGDSSVRRRRKDNPDDTFELLQ